MALSEVVAAVLGHFALRGPSRFDLARSVTDVALTVGEWEEFLRVCGEAGTPQRAQLDVFKSVLRMIDRYGDDGYGDKPADMSRVVYWFQHVPPARSRSPRRAPRGGNSQRVPQRAAQDPAEGEQGQ
jgi:hypothetical protein